ncbi:bifunctional serine/threonine-protein kinase/ABC transporter substrate-binding protein [Microcoleus sp. Pol11C2]|uniref:bifunctional serine/threonine-protein kinase/ABC transporter substrate-binding protein n=1 Tax=Microcoleus sp. Pol11C2 TaxID=3055389 RepID=UPI002FD19099
MWYDRHQRVQRVEGREQFMCLNAGDILRDRYQIIGQLGQGGFARTYTANDALGSHENPLCVVKEIPPPESNDGRLLEEAQQQFEKEAKTLKYLDKCPQIPKLIDRFLEKGKFYLIQEYIAGNPLNQELISGKQFNESEVIDLLQDILSVLAFVHERGIIHRDIKPSNLIRRKLDGKIVLVDFGAVKAIGTLAIQGGQITQTRVIGTDGYMPAEQLTNQPRFNSDIYAVGIIGIQAIAGLDIQDFLNHKKTGELVWHYSTHDRPMIKINSKLEKILNKMVRYHFNDRYQSAAEVLQHLRSVVVSPSPPIETATQVGVEYSIARDSKTPSPPNLRDGLSAGEKILFTSSQPWLKQKGVKEFAASNSEQAFNTFKESWHNEDGKDPETLIYLNNAFLEVSNAPYYTIAVVLSVCRRNPDSFSQLGEQAKEYLRGVAQAQTEVNLRVSNSNAPDFPDRGFLPSKGINGKKLKVIIADDANDEEEAKQRAISVVDRPDILAVIGHASSEMTMHAVDIYNNNNLVLMSPGAATGELTHEPRKFFFRTQYTSSLIAKDLAKYLREQNQTQVAILYNPRSPFGASFVKGYKNYFRRLGGTIVRIQDFDLFKKDFNTARAIEEIQRKGETAIVLVPDPHHSRTLDSAFEIIKLNGSRNWIVGAWMLMCPQMLELASGQPQKLFKKLIFSVGWHPLNSPNPEFPQQARSLWGEEGNTRIASGYDAARALIKALEMQEEPSREGMQRTLSSPDFSAWGATGTIQFNSPTNGDRKNPPSDLVHIVECPKEPFGLAFVPVKYPTAAEAGLNCD